MNNGDDTAFYLHLGHRVVAIEADPLLCSQTEARFAEAIAEGRLQILNLGVTREEGLHDFFISNKYSVWNSFVREIAERESGCKVVKVRCLPFGEVLDQYGQPWYLKIDIEGHDQLCLEALQGREPVPFVSFEMGHQDGDQQLKFMHSLGYERFKCVRQNDFAVITGRNVKRQSMLAKALARGGPGRFGVRVWRKLCRTINTPGDAGYVFPRGSSGWTSDRVPGRWLDLKEVLEIWAQLAACDRDLGGGGVTEWFDFHAAHKDLAPEQQSIPRGAYWS